jgi:hypothetical protein
MSWARHVVCMVEVRSAYTFLWENMKGSYPLGDRGVDRRGNITMDLREIELKDMDCIRLAQNRIQWRSPVSTVMNRRIF